MLFTFTPRFSLLKLATTQSRLVQSRLVQSRLVVPRNFSTSSILFKESIAKAKTQTTKKATATKKKSTSTKAKTSAKASAKKTVTKKAATKKPVKKVKELTKTELKKKEKPKKPLNNFSLYYKENFDKFYTPGEKVQLAVSKASKAWKELPESVKAEYTVKTENDRKEYQKLKDEWLAKYKRPLTGYTKFIKLNIDRTKCSTIDDAKSQVKELATKWSSFTPEEKDSWKAKEL